MPLTVIAMVMIHFSVPPRDRSTGPPERVDVVGGVLLAIALGLAVVGLYNPAPDGKQVLPQLRAAARRRRDRRRDRVLRVGAVRAHPADRAGRRAVPAVPGRAGRRRCARAPR